MADTDKRESGGFTGRLKAMLGLSSGGPGKPTGEIRRILSEMERNDGHFPEAAFKAAVAHREEITPHLLRIIEETTRNAEARAGHDRYIAHVCAMYLLAQFREKRAYPLIVRFLRIPGDVVEDLLGDAITEGVDRILASVFDGDIKPIKELVEDRNANVWARSAGITALETMVLNGIVDRQNVVEYFRSLFRGGLERSPSCVWGRLVAVLADLRATECIDEIRKAYDDELVDDMSVDLDEVEADLARSRDAVPAGQEEYDRGLVGNAADEMSWWSCFHPEDDDDEEFDEEDDEFDDDDDEEWDEDEVAPEPYMRPEPKVGRNDPCPCGSGKKFKKCCGVE